MSALLEGKEGFWEVVIGIEAHAQIVAQSKLFSDAPAIFGAEPNSSLSLVDAGLPGMLPVLNPYCVEQAVRVGLALHARINRLSIFDRKNYFYPDLPTGYQISQYTCPIISEGQLTIDLPDGSEKTIGIERLHLEQDAGKSIHDQDPLNSFIDLNRAGIGLMEIVSKPDIRGAEETGLYIAKLRTLLRYLGACDGNMQEGSLRADLNVSVRRPHAEHGTRCEIKNVNSIRFARQAVTYEAHRQIALIEEGGQVNQETRFFDPSQGMTRTLRSKEDAEDYRYFPDPDLPPLLLDEAMIAQLKAQLPELPNARKARFIADLGLPKAEAIQITDDRNVADYFEKTLEAAKVNSRSFARDTALWILSEVFAALSRRKEDITSYPVSPMKLASLLKMIQQGQISRRVAKEIFDVMIEKGQPPEEIVAELGLEQISDSETIRTLVDTVLASYPQEVASYRDGKEKLWGFFVGKVMQASSGKANPTEVNQALCQRLKGL